MCLLFPLPLLENLTSSLNNMFLIKLGSFSNCFRKNSQMIIFMERDGGRMVCRLFFLNIPIFQWVASCTMQKNMLFWKYQMFQKLPQSLPAPAEASRHAYIRPSLQTTFCPQFHYYSWFICENFHPWQILVRPWGQIFLIGF